MSKVMSKGKLRILVATAAFVGVLLSSLSDATSGGGTGRGNQGWIGQTLKSQKAPAAPQAVPAAKPKPQQKAKQPTQLEQAAKAAQQAAAEAGGGIDGCAKNFQQKPLYDCVAQRLDDLAAALEKNTAARDTMQKAIAALRTAATEMKAATLKEQAVSALQKAKSAIDTAITAAKKTGSAAGFGPRAGLAAISSTLGKAMAAVQKRG